MAVEIDYKQTKRAYAFEMWMKSPMPMVTIIKTLDVTRLVKYAGKNKLKFNMLLCWCIGKAASQMDEFYIIPVDGKLMKYEHLAIDVVLTVKSGAISTCSIPYSDDLTKFNESYLKLTSQVYDSCNMYALDDTYGIIGTSALIKYEVDGVVNQYSGIYNNPFLIWGKYRKHWWKFRLPLSFQFHHVQMDGGNACEFLESLQKEIDNLK